MSHHSSLSNVRIKVALICGGPSEERGISLNSARSVLDHLSPHSFDISVYYVTPSMDWYGLSPYHLYSNSPSDFDFKLSQMGSFLTETALLERLKNCDIAFPVIHGAFGEDGQLQGFFETHHIPFVGPSSSMCQAMFSKRRVSDFLKSHGYAVLPSCLLLKNATDLWESISDFFQSHSLKRAIIKPDSGGSSIGVTSVETPQEAFDAAQTLFQTLGCSKVILEPFCEGQEFTLVVLQNHQGQPVALIPTEIKIPYDQGQFFDYRSKYLPTSHTELLCPASFSPSLTRTIQRQAEDLFSLYGLRDFVRIDGWVLRDGCILFTDFNPISGLEQNSFLFLQASHSGLTHEEILSYIIHTACARYNLPLPVEKISSPEKQRHPVWVVFGGPTAERQVSVMSGTNVWLKLMRSEFYDPSAFFLDPEGFLWNLPYAACLHHTVEEIHKKCLSHESAPSPSVEDIRGRLGLDLKNPLSLEHPLEKMSLETFIHKAKEKGAFVFLALHGGAGEDGTWQKKLSDAQICYNGSTEMASRLCMDKQATGRAIEALNDPFIKSLPKQAFSANLFKTLDEQKIKAFWNDLPPTLGKPPYIVKPQCDGCSSGIVPLESWKDLLTYMHFIHKGVPCIPPRSLKGQDTPLELSSKAAESSYLLEPFIQTDTLKVEGTTLVHTPHSGWFELTVAVFESYGIYHALNPSITVSSHQVLNVEEKFQGGTGTNITPPPPHLISSESVQKIKQAIEKVAQTLGIENYARIDCFFNTVSNQIIIIEANSLPALTPSTVLYHQALAEPSPLTPLMVLERFVHTKLHRAHHCPTKAQNQATL